MRIRPWAVWTLLAATGLAAQGSDQGFSWVGLQAGSLSFDPQENVKAAPFFGAQGGLVFAQKRYGLKFDGFVAHPKSDLIQGKTLNHSEASVSFLTGLAGEGASRFWPYLGLGLGAVSVPKVAPTTLVQVDTKGSAAHVSLGFLHRPGAHLIWGMDARYLLTFTPKDLKEFQGSVLVGFTWGRGQSASRPVAEPPRSEGKPPPPPAPRPAVVSASPPVAPPPAPVEVVVPQPPPPPPAMAPIPRVAAPPAPVPAPRPVPRAMPAEGHGAGGSAKIQRLDALLLGDLAKSVELGRKRLEAIPAGHWTLRLEIADLPSTLKHAVAAFPAGDPDLFIAPIQLRGGRTSYQLFLGEYPTLGAAQRAAKAVPAFFLEGGQRPRPFLATSIPSQGGK